MLGARSVRVFWCASRNGLAGCEVREFGCSVLELRLGQGVCVSPRDGLDGCKISGQGALGSRSVISIDM